MNYEIQEKGGSALNCVVQKHRTLRQLQALARRSQSKHAIQTTRGADFLHNCLYMTKESWRAEEGVGSS